MPIVICVNWTESERGWGQRPDGCSLHLSEKDRIEFIEKYNESLPKDHVPHEYSFPDGVKPLEITKKVFNLIKKNGGSLRIWQHECRKVLGDGY